MLHRFRAASLLWPTLAAVPALGVLVGLGVWQWQRMAWKNALIAGIEARASETPLGQHEALNLKCSTVDAGVAGACEFRRVRLSGRFDYLGERFVFAGVRAVDGRSAVGYWAFTPFSPAGVAQKVYVNRGFVPEQLRTPERRSASRADGEVEIVAQIRMREVRGWFDGVNERERNLYYVRDPVELSGSGASDGAGDDRAIGPPTRYLEIVAAPGQTGFPRPLAGAVMLPNRHFEYVLTWWGLALTLIGVYGSFAWTRMRMVG